MRTPAKKIRRIRPASQRGVRAGFFCGSFVFAVLCTLGISRLVSEPSSISQRPSAARSEPHAIASENVFAPLDPERVLADVLRHPESMERTRVLLGTLRDWAHVDPAAATNWARAHPAVDHTTAMTEIFSTANDTPRDLVSWAEGLAHDDPAEARDYRYAVIFGLNRRAEFAASTSYAAAAPEEIRRDLLIAAYHDWGRREPELAMISATHVEDATTRQTALQSTLSGWARTDPEGLADTAVNFPAGAEKSTALTKALRAWMVKDPGKAGDWIIAHPEAVPSAEAALRND